MIILLSETFKKIGTKPSMDKTSILELIEEFQDNSILLTMIFFSLLIAVPLPYPPGVKSLLGIPLIMLSFQILLGHKKVKLPKKITQYKIKNSTLKKITTKLVPIIIFIEKYIKPRTKFVKSVYCAQLVGLICLIASFSIIFPLPLTDLIPAFGIAVTSLGLLNRDGIVIIVGLSIAIIGILITISVAIASFAAIKYLFSTIF